MHHDRATPNRRMFLSGTIQAAGAVLGAGAFAPLLAGEGSRGFKIGACDWSLRKHADPAAFDVAKQIGIDGIQAALGRTVDDAHLLRAETQRKYLDAARRTGMEICSLAITALNDVPLKSDPRAARLLERSIDVCTALGLKITMPGCFGKGDLDMSNTAEIDHLVKVLKEAPPRAEKTGILIGLESYLSAEDNMRLLERVGSPALRVYYDVGNSTDKGRDIIKEIRALGKLICEFHFKDGPHLLGKGRIDFREVRRAIDEIDYRGWVVLESASPNGVARDYAEQAAWLRQLFPRKV
jgi:sugar phosphate isomerase/epimerase